MCVGGVEWEGRGGEGFEHGRVQGVQGSKCFGGGDAGVGCDAGGLRYVCRGWGRHI